MKVLKNLLVSLQKDSHIADFSGRAAFKRRLDFLCEYLVVAQAFSRLASVSNPEPLLVIDFSESCQLVRSLFLPVAPGRRWI
jgi:hypothetical protein